VSIHDRAWYREQDEPAFSLSLISAAWILIGATFAGFLGQEATANAGYGVFLRAHVALSADGVLRGEAWQPVSYLLLHADLGHLLFNLIALFFFARVVEPLLGRGRTLGLYLAAGVGGAAGHLLWTAAGLAAPSAPVVGASGAITGLLAYGAFRAPRTPFLLFFLLPVPLWLLGAIFVGWDLLAAVQGTAGRVAVQAHVGGAAVGALWFVLSGKGLGRWRLVPRAALFRRAPRLDPVLDRPTPVEEAEDAEVDRLLDRIHVGGIDSLSETEKEFLKRVSRRLREDGSG